MLARGSETKKQPLLPGLSPEDLVVFIQPFSFGEPSGGTQILRSVCLDAPCRTLSICTGPSRPLRSTEMEEIPLPGRISLGRLERSRFAWLGGYLERLAAGRFRRRLTELLRRLRPAAVHLIPHANGDFIQAYAVSRELGIPVCLSVHDDLEYSARSHPFLRGFLTEMGNIWCEADVRFVISVELGEEYCARYGRREYFLHTDGKAVRQNSSYLPPSEIINIYFMGLFHYSYQLNLVIFLKSLSKYLEVNPGKIINLKMRCGEIPILQNERPAWLEVLPFASAELVASEIMEAHFLYFPLPFGDGDAALSQFSFSTKLISYLSSGTPIIYHGPVKSAAWQYLLRNKAATGITTILPGEVDERLLSILGKMEELPGISDRARVAAARDFEPEALRGRFWGAVAGCAKLGEPE